jgi:hypothetical protein
MHMYPVIVNSVVDPKLFVMDPDPAPIFLRLLDPDPNLL